MINSKNVRLIGLLVLLALVFIFALQNVVDVEVRFLFWSITLPRSLLIFTVLVVGVIVGWFLRAALRKSRS
jgi:uncharacterized integral membrane protein